MKARSIALLLSFLCALSGPAVALDVDNPPKGAFIDEWYVININGKKSGHAHIRMERAREDSVDIVRTETDMKFAMRRGNIQLDIGVLQQTEETLDGKPLGFASNRDMGMLGSMMLKGTISDGKVKMTTMQFGQQADESVYAIPDDAMMEWAVHRTMLEKGFKVGLEYQVPYYEPSTQPERTMPMTIKITGREKIDLYGRKVETFTAVQSLRMKNMLGQVTDVESRLWLTEDGNLAKLETSMAGLNLELFNCAKSVAMAPNDPAELMTDMLIRMNQPVDEDAERITYLLKVKRGADNFEIPELPETRMQSVRPKPGNQMEIVVRRLSGRPEKPGSVKLSAEERERYLAARGMINHKDSEIVKLANRAAGEEKDPWKLAGKLTQFVNRYIRGKNLSVGFASASEVARSREGDCTEHGVLLAALGRARGIPTRVVTGVVYAEEFLSKRGVFVGHLWTQFFIDGHWVDLDATRPAPAVDATHIAMTLSDGGDGGLADLVNGLWLNLAQLEIKVIDSKSTRKK